MSPSGTLVAIDLQRIFAAGPWGAPRFAEVLAPTKRLVAAFGESVVFTRFLAPAEPRGSWQDYYRQWPFALQPPDAPDYQLVPEFDRYTGRTVDATTFGKWNALADTGAFEIGAQLVVCGVSTDCCVISTVLAAADAGMSVCVVADACAGVDDDSHAKALHVMALYAPLVQVVSAADVLDP